MSNVLSGDDGLKSIRLIFHALITIGFLKEKFKDIPTVDVYQDDWKEQLKDQDESWIITPIHYFPGGKRIHRKTPGGGTWDNRDQKEKNYEKTTWCERKFKYVESTNEQQATNNGTGLKKYTMIEYFPNKEDKPQYALCRITVDNKKSAHDRPPSNSQQPEIKEIEHTDSNNGDKGGNFENATGYYNQFNLKMCIAQFVQGEVLSEFRKSFSKAHILQVFSREMDEIEIPDASPKEHSTEAAVRNPRKRGRCTSTNTMEAAGTSQQGQEQVKVEMFVSNPYQEKPTNLHCDTNRHWSEFGEQSTHHGNCNKKNAEQATSTSNFATIHEQHTVEELLLLCNSNDDVFGQNVQDSHNFNANYTEPITENRYYLPSYNQNIIAPGPTRTYYAPTVPPITDQGTYNAFEEEQSSLCNIQHGQVFEQNVQDTHNFNANSTEPIENRCYLPGYNHNIIAPGPTPSYYAPTVPLITDQGTYNLFEEQHGQMFEPIANVQEPNNISLHFIANSTEPVENSNHLPSYNQNTIAPGPSTINWRTTEPENMDWINNMDLAD